MQVSSQQHKKCKIDKQKENALRSSSRNSKTVASKSRNFHRHCLKQKSPIKKSPSKSKLRTRHPKCSSGSKRKVFRSSTNPLVLPPSSDASHSNAPNTVMSKHKVDHDNTAQGPSKVTVESEDEDQVQDRSNLSKVFVK